MITKFLTEVSARLNPFAASAKSARLFLTYLPPNARSSMAVSTTMLPRESAESSSLRLKFKDGQEMKFDCARVSIKGLIEEVDRHSRQLQKAADLEG